MTVWAGLGRFRMYVRIQVMTIGGAIRTRDSGLWPGQQAAVPTLASVRWGVCGNLHMTEDFPVVQSRFCQHLFSGCLDLSLSPVAPVGNGAN